MPTPKEERLQKFNEALSQLKEAGRHLTINGICSEFGFAGSWAYTDPEVKKAYRDYSETMKALRNNSITAIQREVLESNGHATTITATLTPADGNMIDGPATELLKLQAENLELKARIEALEKQQEPLSVAISKRLQMWQQKADRLRHELTNADRMIELLSDLKESEV